jgi:hypothetical protein
MGIKLIDFIFNFNQRTTSLRAKRSNLPEFQQSAKLDGISAIIAVCVKLKIAALRSQ